MNFFRQQREALGLTQRKIAAALDMTTSAVSLWECNRTIPDVSLFDKLAAIYQVTPERIALEALKMSRQRETVSV